MQDLRHWIMTAIILITVGIRLYRANIVYGAEEGDTFLSSIEKSQQNNRESMGSIFFLIIAFVLIEFGGVIWGD